MKASRKRSMVEAEKEESPEKPAAKRHRGQPATTKPATSLTEKQKSGTATTRKSSVSSKARSNTVKSRQTATSSRRKKWAGSGSSTKFPIKKIKSPSPAKGLAPLKLKSPSPKKSEKPSRSKQHQNKDVEDEESSTAADQTLETPSKGKSQTRKRKMRSDGPETSPAKVTPRSVAKTPKSASKSKSAKKSAGRVTKMTDGASSSASNRSMPTLAQNFDLATETQTPVGHGKSASTKRRRKTPKSSTKKKSAVKTSTKMSAVKSTTKKSAQKSLSRSTIKSAAGSTSTKKSNQKAKSSRKSAKRQVSMEDEGEDILDGSFLQFSAQKEGVASPSKTVFPNKSSKKSPKSKSKNETTLQKSAKVTPRSAAMTSSTKKKSAVKSSTKKSAVKSTTKKSAVKSTTKNSAVKSTTKKSARKSLSRSTIKSAAGSTSTKKSNQKTKSTRKSAKRHISLEDEGEDILDGSFLQFSAQKVGVASPVKTQIPKPNQTVSPKKKAKKSPKSKSKIVNSASSSERISTKRGAESATQSKLASKSIGSVRGNKSQLSTSVVGVEQEEGTEGQVTVPCRKSVGLAGSSVKASASIPRSTKKSVSKQTTATKAVVYEKTAATGKRSTPSPSKSFSSPTAKGLKSVQRSAVSSVTRLNLSPKMTPVSFITSTSKSAGKQASLRKSLLKSLQKPANISMIENDSISARFQSRALGKADAGGMSGVSVVAHTSLGRSDLVSLRSHVLQASSFESASFTQYVERKSSDTVERYTSAGIEHTGGDLMYRAGGYRVEHEEGVHHNSTEEFGEWANENTNSILSNSGNLTNGTSVSSSRCVIL